MKIANALLVGVALISGHSLSKAQSQEVRAVKWNASSPGAAEIVSLDPTDASKTNLINEVDLGQNRVYIPNTLSYVKEDNSMYFFTQSAFFSTGQRFASFSAEQRLLLANATTGEVMREIPFPNTTLVAPFVISEEGQVGFISSEQTHNSYGNNDDNVSLVVFNLSTGEVAHKIQLPSLSFGGVSAPFYGEVESNNINNGFGTGGKSMISISSPCYVSSTNRLLFAGRDVIGINRLYVFDLKNGTLVSQSQLSINILDMVYDYKNNVVKTLYVEDLEGSKELRLGDLTLASNTISNSTLVRTLKADETVISDGSIELDANTGSVYVVKTEGTKEHIYTFDNDLTILDETVRSTDDKVDFEFSAPVSKSQAATFGNLVKVYPNPAVDEVTIETISMTTVTQIRVLNNIGQEVKDVLVQSNEMSNTINISNLVTGIYMIEIHSDRAEVMYEKLIVE